MRKKTKKIIGITAVSVVGALIAVVAVFIIYVVVCNASNSVPFVGNNAVLRVATQSMGDTIPPGTYILVEKVDPDDIKEGDIITFASRDPMIEGRLNTHRVVAIGEQDGKRAFTTQGDNKVTNPNPDGFRVFDEDVRGRYVENLETLTAAASVLISPFGLVFVIFIPAVIMMTVSIVDIIKKAREIKTEEKLSDEEKIAREVERLRLESEKNPPEVNGNEVNGNDGNDRDGD